MTEKTIHQSISAALVAAQAKMGKALKDSENPHFRSKYADLSSVMAACMPALNAEGIAVIQPTTDEDGQRYVKTILLHGASAETLECRVPLIVNKNDMQGYGSAVTYARRYGLMCMAGIAPEDDDGNAAANAAPKYEPKQRRPERKTEPSAVDMAAESLSRASSVEQLQAIWVDLPTAVKGHAFVVTAKDRRKAELSQTALGNAPIDDEIPY